MDLRGGHHTARGRTHLVVGGMRPGGSVGGLLVAASVSLLVTACGSGGESAAGQSRNAASAGVTQRYQRLIDFYAAESGSKVDPMVFVPAPRARAAVGPLMVRHVAGITPAKHTTPSTTSCSEQTGLPSGSRSSSGSKQAARPRSDVSTHRSASPAHSRTSSRRGHTARSLFIRASRVLVGKPFCATSDAPSPSSPNSQTGAAPCSLIGMCVRPDSGMCGR
jgi:hypothetical protein